MNNLYLMAGTDNGLMVFSFFAFLLEALLKQPLSRDGFVTGPVTNCEGPQGAQTTKAEATQRLRQMHGRCKNEMNK